MSEIRARSTPRSFRIHEYEHFQKQLADHKIVGQTVLYDIYNTNIHHDNNSDVSVGQVKKYDDDDNGDDGLRHDVIDNKVTISNSKSVSTDCGSWNQWYERNNNNNNNNNNILEVDDDNLNNNGKDKVRTSNFNSYDSRDDKSLNSYHSPGNHYDNFKNISSISDRIIYSGTGSSYNSNNNNNSTTPITTETARLQKKEQLLAQGLLSTTPKHRGGIIASSSTSSAHKAHNAIVGTPLQDLSSEPFVLESKLKKDLTTSILDREEESRARYDLEQSKQLMINMYQVNEVKLMDEIANLKNYYSARLSEKEVLYNTHHDSKQLEISKLEGRIHELIDNHKQALHEKEEYYLQQINQQDLIWKDRITEMEDKHLEVIQAMNSKHFIEKSGREISEKAKMDVKEEHWKQVCEKKLKKYEAQVMIMMMMMTMMTRGLTIYIVVVVMISMIRDHHDDDDDGESPMTANDDLSQLCLSISHPSLPYTHCGYC